MTIVRTSKRNRDSTPLSVQSLENFILLLAYSVGSMPEELCHGLIFLIARKKRYRLDPKPVYAIAGNRLVSKTISRILENLRAKGYLQRGGQFSLTIHGRNAVAAMNERYATRVREIRRISQSLLRVANEDPAKVVDAAAFIFRDEEINKNANEATTAIVVYFNRL